MKIVLQAIASSTELAASREERIKQLQRLLKANPKSPHTAKRKNELKYLLQKPKRDAQRAKHEEKKKQHRQKMDEAERSFKAARRAGDGPAMKRHLKKLRHHQVRYGIHDQKVADLKG